MLTIIAALSGVATLTAIVGLMYVADRIIVPELAKRLIP